MDLDHRYALKSLKEDLHSVWSWMPVVLTFAVPLGLLYIVVHFIVKYW